MKACKGRGGLAASPSTHGICANHPWAKCTPAWTFTVGSAPSHSRPNPPFPRSPSGSDEPPHFCSSGGGAIQWPVFKWAGGKEDVYFARLIKNAISVYQVWGRLWIR